MAHFYGTLKGARGEATRCGTRNSGITAVAASWKGAIQVSVTQDADGNDCFVVSQMRWKGEGIDKVIATGIIGQPANLNTKTKGL